MTVATINLTCNDDFVKPIDTVAVAESLAKTYWDL
jgi:hypothetical protein